MAKPLGWELEAAGHISIVRTQRRWISAASSFVVFTSVQDPSPRNGIARGIFLPYSQSDLEKDSWACPEVGLLDLVK